MKQQFVADLSPGASVCTTFLVQDKEQRYNRAGEAYLDLELRDATGVVRGRSWDHAARRGNFEKDDIVQVEGVVEEFQGALHIRIRHVVRCAAEEVTLFDYFPRTRRDPEELYAWLVARLRRLTEGPLRTLVLAILEDPQISFKYKLAPAAISYHHAYLGGLLEHVSSLVALGDKVCDHYPSLDRDLLITGLVLHDLGKIDELTYSRGFGYSTRGRLLGHAVMALEIVRDKLRTLSGFPQSLRDQIEHIILSHHGKLEWGAPKEPMFPEALAVHYLDDLDSKLASMRAQYEADHHRAGDWTARNRALGRELLKKQVKA
jgi:3'-5' exoribonuclease